MRHDTRFRQPTRSSSVRASADREGGRRSRALTEWLHPAASRSCYVRFPILTDTIAKDDQYSCSVCAARGHAEIAEQLLMAGQFLALFLLPFLHFLFLLFFLSRFFSSYSKRLLCVCVGITGAEPAVCAMNGDSAVKIAARAGHELVAIMLQVDPATYLPTYLLGTRLLVLRKRVLVQGVCGWTRGVCRKHAGEFL